LSWHKLTQGVLVLDSVSVPILDNGCTGLTPKGVVGKKWIYHTGF